MHRPVGQLRAAVSGGNEKARAAPLVSSFRVPGSCEAGRHPGQVTSALPDRFIRQVVAGGPLGLFAALLVWRRKLHQTPGPRWTESIVQTRADRGE